MKLWEERESMNRGWRQTACISFMCTLTLIIACLTWEWKEDQENTKRQRIKRRSNKTNRVLIMMMKGLPLKKRIRLLVLSLHTLETSRRERPVYLLTKTGTRDTECNEDHSLFLIIKMRAHMLYPQRRERNWRSFKERMLWLRRRKRRRRSKKANAN